MPIKTKAKRNEYTSEILPSKEIIEFLKDRNTRQSIKAEILTMLVYSISLNKIKIPILLSKKYEHLLQSVKAESIQEAWQSILLNNRWNVVLNIDVRDSKSNFNGNLNPNGSEWNLMRDNGFSSTRKLISRKIYVIIIWHILKKEVLLSARLHTMMKLWER